MIKNILIHLIEFYQKYLSLDTGYLSKFFPGGYCKYTPNCSEYCKQSIIKHGVIKGSVLGFYRVLRCNPWSHGGYDPIK